MSANPPLQPPEHRLKQSWEGGDHGKEKLPLHCWSAEGRCDMLRLLAMVPLDNVNAWIHTESMTSVCCISSGFTLHMTVPPCPASAVIPGHLNNSSSPKRTASAFLRTWKYLRLKEKWQKQKQRYSLKTFKWQFIDNSFSDGKRKLLSEYPWTLAVFLTAFIAATLVAAPWGKVLWKSEVVKTVEIRR